MNLLYHNWTEPNCPLVFQNLQKSMHVDYYMWIAARQNYSQVVYKSKSIKCAIHSSRECQFTAKSR